MIPHYELKAEDVRHCAIKNTFLWKRTDIVVRPR